jgi:hypothetical protein
MKKHKHKHKKHKHHKHPTRTRKPQTAPHRKTHPLRAGNPSKTKGRATPRRSPSPRAVHRAIHRLLDTTNHIQARAAELENALEALREQEHSSAVKQLLLALRKSPDGDLLRSNPAAPGDAANSTAQAIIGALVEAFSIVPIRNIGERIPVRDGHIPDTLDLDRSIGDEVDTCVEAEVVSVGWSYSNQTLLKPVVRPLFATQSPSYAAEANVSGTALDTSSTMPPPPA